jgi:ABC-type antimicrobial peptide transport system permease subunit
MKGYTTSFQIPNGTTKAYLEKFNALGIDNLEISFYDGGYEKLAAGMKNVRQVAIILLAVSTVTTLALLVFFIYMFVSKQKKRTAIERSLGMSRKECTKSMLYGILGVITAGSVSGGGIGFLITRFVMPSSKGEESEIYMTEFSNWINNADKVALSNTGTAANMVITLLACLLVILVSYGLALLYIRSNLRTEPLALLSKNEE